MGDFDKGRVPVEMQFLCELKSLQQELSDELKKCEWSSTNRGIKAFKNDLNSSFADF